MYSISMSILLYKVVVISSYSFPISLFCGNIAHFNLNFLSRLVIIFNIFYTSVIILSSNDELFLIVVKLIILLLHINEFCN